MLPPLAAGPLRPSRQFFQLPVKGLQIGEAFFLGLWGCVNHGRGFSGLLGRFTVAKKLSATGLGQLWAWGIPPGKLFPIGLTVLAKQWVTRSGYSPNVLSPLQDYSCYIRPASAKLELDRWDARSRINREQTRKRIGVDGRADTPGTTAGPD